MEQKVNKACEAVVSGAAAASGAAGGARGLSPAGRAAAGRRQASPARPAGRRRQCAATFALLQRLSAEGAFLAPAPAGDGWMLGLTGVRTGADGSKISLGGGLAPGQLVRSMAAAGLLEPPAGGAGNRLELSAAGRARIVRERAPDAPFLAQHARLGREQREVEGIRATVTVNHAESPLSWLRRRRGRDGHSLIDEIAWAAGERFRADVERAQMTPRMTVNWETPASSGARAQPPSPGDMALAARQRVRRAMEAVGPDMAGVLLDVCGFLKGLEQLERDRGWPARSGKVVLAMALARLAAHYGLQAEGRGRQAGRIQNWRA